MPGLQKQMLSVDFGQGVDTKTATEKVVHGRLTALVNGEFDKAGAINKRKGFDSVANAPGGTVNTVFTRGDELAVLERVGVKTWLSNWDEWRSANQPLVDAILSVPASGTDPRPSEVSVADVVGTVSQSSAITGIYADSAEANGILCVAWAIDTGTTNLYAVLIERATNQVLLGPTVISNGLTTAGNGETEPRLVAVGDRYIHLITHADGGAELYGRVIDAAFLPSGWPSRATLRTDLTTASQRKDVCLHNNGTSCWVGYRDNGGTGGLTLFEHTSSNTATGVVTYGVDPSEALAMDLHPETGYVVFAYADSGAAGQVDWFDPGGPSFSGTPLSVHGALIGTGVNNAAVVKSDATHVWVLIEETVNGTQPNVVRWRQIDISGLSPATGGSTENTNWVGIAAKPFYDSTLAQAFFHLVYESETDPVHMLVTPTYTAGTTFGDATPVARLRQDVVAGFRPQGYIPAAHNPETGVYQCVALRRTKFKTLSGVTSWYHGIDTIEVDLLPDRNMPWQESRDGVLIGGGQLLHYGGQYAHESTMHTRPVIESSSAGGTGTFYKAIYEWEDEGGNLHRSGPSEAFETGAYAGSRTCDVRLPPVSMREGVVNLGITVSLYRTEASGTIYYKVASSSPQSPGITTVTVVDNVPDADLTDNELLYTQGGVVENDCPPACWDVLSAKNRVFLVSSHDRKQVWFSKTLQEGIAPEFSAAFVKRSDAGKGPITAIASLDDKIVVFHESEVFVFYGDGPTATGINDTFTDMQRVATDVGCIERRSVVETPLGVMFKSNKGIYLLTRSLEAKYVGAPVELYNDGTIHSAVLVEDKNQVRFTVSGSSQTVATGVAPDVLVYDYLFDQWSTWEMGLQALAGSVTGGVLWDGVHTLSTTSTLYPQKTSGSTQWKDGSSWQTFLVETAWIKPSGMQGYQRIWRANVLGSYEGDHYLWISSAYDYSSTYTHSHRWLASETFAIGNGQYRYPLPRQKVESVRLVIYDADAVVDGGGTDNGNSLILTGLQLEVGVLPGVHRRSAAQTG